MARVEQTIEVNVPISTAYNQMTQFEEFPRFMEGVHSVRQLDEAHLHWCAKKGGQEMEWDAEITRQIPDTCIAWRNTSGPKNEGEVRFDAIEPGKTRITLTMDAEDHLLKHPEAVGDTTPQPDQDLARFKEMIESRHRESGAWRGEIRDGRRIDDTEPAAPALGGSVVGQTTDQILEEAMRPSTQLANIVETQTQTIRQAWPAPAWAPDFSRYWEDQLALWWQFGRQMERMLFGWLQLSSPQPALAPAAVHASEWMPPVELAERNGAVVVCADLPGVRSEDVQVEVAGKRLIIEGDRRNQVSALTRESERPHGRFYRAISLPVDVDADASEATIHDGVLEVTLPMASGARSTRRLEVRQTSQ